jgi:hypothetical protein
MAKNGTRKHRTHKHRTRPLRGAASPTSARRLEALEKQRQALALRMAGASFDEIAESLGYADRGGAHKAVMAAIESTLPEPALQVRELELKRLDRLWLAAWKAATDGDLQAIAVCLQIMKRRADFEGLDKAKKLEHTGPDGKAIPIKIINFGLNEADANEERADTAPVRNLADGGNEISIP